MKVKNSGIRNIVVLAVTTVVVLVGIWFVNSGIRGTQEADSTGGFTSLPDTDSGADAPKVGEPAPAFSVKTTDGRDISIGGEREHPIWLIFNATWCQNCRAEMPDIQQMQEKHGDNVDIVSIYVNDSPTQVADYSKQLNLTFAQAPDADGRIGALYRGMGVPMHFFITKAGTISSIDVGALSESRMEDELSKIIQP